DWSERKGNGDDINSVIREIYRRTAGIASAQIRASQSPMISGYGTGSGFELYVQDRSGTTTDELLRVTRMFIDSLNARPEISRAYTTFDTKFPQYMVEVDAVKCMRNGVSPADVLSALAGYVGGSYSSNLNRFTKLYRVMVQASPESRLDTESLKKMHVRTSSGAMSSIDNYITLTRVYGSESLSRFNLFPSISVFGEQGEGYSSGEAINAIKSVASEVLPSGYGYEFGGMSREESGAGNTTVIVFCICLAFIYLILSALYESVTIPFAVISAVPFGVAGCFLFARWWGIENNINMHIGLIMVIGLRAKTAILLTEYATARRKEGMGLVASAVSAAKARFRPIIMTSATMVFGMLPLMFASGVGANGNISVGVGTVGGLLVGTLALLFMVPVFFIIFQYAHEKIAQRRGHLPLK
ncbi:MAG: efflux RND transporter permease subunit, partial [Muribaculaceae bacterium]|nr:efflux RND transporter permease subunit [Muribaculaceae bacterium]